MANEDKKPAAQPAAAETPEAHEPAGGFAETVQPGEAAGAAAAEPAGADAATLAEELAEAREQAAQLKNEYLRALAEQENIRRRAERDRTEARQYAVAKFAADLLSVADNCRRAIESVDPAQREANASLSALVGGVEMTERELLAVLERHGVKPIKAEGELFDPHVHEAMFEVPDPSVTAGTVVQVLQQGFLLHDRTLRPASVGVAKGGPKPEPKPAVEADAAETDESKVSFKAHGSSNAYDTQGGAAAGSQMDESY